MLAVNGIPVPFEWSKCNKLADGYSCSPIYLKQRQPLLLIKVGHSCLE